MADEFISYANEYDLYKGEVDIGSLPVTVQDNFIRHIFDTQAKFRDFVIEHRIMKSQAEGLWRIIVLIGMTLEDDKQIENFEERSDADVRKIINELSGTNLWLRLEEAFPPFSSLSSRTEYDWRELQQVASSAFPDLAGEPLHKIKAGVFKVLSRRKVNTDFDTRMPYDQFKRFCAEKSISVHVDRMLAARAGAAGFVKSSAPQFVSASIVAVLSSLVLLIAYGVLFAAVALAIAVFLFKQSYKSTQKAIYLSAMGDRERYRWLLSRQVIWIKWLNADG